MPAREEAPPDLGPPAGVWVPPALAQPVQPEASTPFAQEESRLEALQRLLCLPVALGLAWLAMSAPMLSWLLQVFLGMWLHELGHAVTAWLCGFPAFPMPWFTPTGDTREVWVSLLLAGLVGTWGWRGWRAGSRPQAALAVVALGLQLVGTVVLQPRQAQALLYFGGDGGSMVLGSLLMATVYASPESALRRRWLHWGLLVIGAVGFADAFSTWWEARSDFAAIPFGAQEGRSLSDASMLVEEYGWDELDLIRRHVRLGGACLAGLAGLYAVGLWRSRAELRALAAALTRRAALRS